ncbi:MAG: pyrroline-5-carboxylate reductase [Magnetococcus sp. WYHC-3]
MSHISRIGFIGGGNMAVALINGLLQGRWSGEHITVADVAPGRAAEVARQFGVQAAADNLSAVAHADVVVLAVKPAQVSKVLDDIRHVLPSHALVISIAAGVGLAALRAHLDALQPLIRVMPNTPALVGAGVSVLCAAEGTALPAVQLAETLLGAVGQTAVVQDEGLMDAVTALSGSGPAYVYLMAEALSDGGVACGLPRPLADQLAVGTLLGSARLLAQGQHPGVLKNQVTSPGGTTLAGLRVMEDRGVRGALMAAVEAAWRRSRELGGR